MYEGPPLITPTTRSLPDESRLLATGTPSLWSPWVSRALKYIEAHYYESINLLLLARVAGCSRSTLARAFQREMGQTAHAYLVQVRLKRAAIRVLTGVKIEAVMLGVGLRSTRNFYRQFRAHFGYTAADYRAKHRRPEACRTNGAPGQDVAVPPLPDRVIYSPEPERDIFEGLDKQARAFGVLATALDCYINHLRHFNDRTLADVATLVHTQGQSTLQSGDEVEVVARRIQAASEQLKALRCELDTGGQSLPAPDKKGDVG
jgi:AraC-like DNA-binding protein